MDDLGKKIRLIKARIWKSGNKEGILEERMKRESLVKEQLLLKKRELECFREYWND